MANGRSGRKSGKILRAGLTHHRTSFHKVLEELFDVLVVDIELLFEIVQLGIIEDFPPLTAQCGIRRLGDSPTSVIRRLRPRLLISRCRCLRRWRMIFWADYASRKSDRECSHTAANLRSVLSVCLKD